MFPMEKVAVAAEGRWKTFQEVQDAYAKVEPNVTDKQGLRTLGFDPHDGPNIRV